ncbi:hypothetical protein GWN42_24880 [candidate division KSB1 bacterium]|nr:hypothetical protein [candidate division KSB1 bacterium]
MFELLTTVITTCTSAIKRALKIKNSKVKIGDIEKLRRKREEEKRKFEQKQKEINARLESVRERLKKNENHHSSDISSID